MTKKQIILDYLSKDGNKEKQTKVQLIEISEIYGVTINRTQFLKVKSNATVNATVESATVESATVESATVESATVESATVESATVESATVNATVVSATVESATVESATVESATANATVSKIEWLDSLMEAIKNSTNVFQMAEAFRQCDCFVQTTGESIKEDIESLIEDLPLYQQNLVYNYGLDKRVCMKK